MGLVSLRGATIAENNTTEDIKNATIELYSDLILQNKIVEDDIVHIIFSVTKDLNAVYPAKVLREQFGLKDTPLFSTQEADIHNSLEKCIRILILTNSELTKKDVKHVYLKGAKNLRPDIIG